MVPTISTGFDCGKTHDTSLSRYCFLFRSSVTIGHVSESEKARRLIPHELNIPYGPLHKEKIDIFGTDLSDDAPLFVFVHGGYWQEQTLTRDTYHFIATNLHKRGAKSMFIGYELCPSVPLTKIIEEAEVATKKCIDYARKHKSK
jgi:arylformamidase